MVISGSVSLYQGMTKLLFAHTISLTANARENWVLFSQQFREELSGSRFIKIDQNRLYVSRKGQELAFGKSRSDDFRKTNAQGRGYQPMLFGIETADFEQDGNLVILVVQFETGLERTFVYAFEDTT